MEQYSFVNCPGFSLPRREVVGPGASLGIQNLVTAGSVARRRGVGKGVLLELAGAAQTMD